MLGGSNVGSAAVNGWCARRWWTAPPGRECPTLRWVQGSGQESICSTAPGVLPPRWRISAPPLLLALFRRDDSRPGGYDGGPLRRLPAPASTSLTGSPEVAHPWAGGSAMASPFGGSDPAMALGGGMVGWCGRRGTATSGRYGRWQACSTTSAVPARAPFALNCAPPQPQQPMTRPGTLKLWQWRGQLSAGVPSRCRCGDRWWWPSGRAEPRPDPEILEAAGGGSTGSE